MYNESHASGQRWTWMGTHVSQVTCTSPCILNKSLPGTWYPGTMRVRISTRYTGGVHTGMSNPFSVHVYYYLIVTYIPVVIKSRWHNYVLRIACYTVVMWTWMGTHVSLMTYTYPCIQHHVLIMITPVYMSPLQKKTGIAAKNRGRQRSRPNPSIKWTLYPRWKVSL